MLRRLECPGPGRTLDRDLRVEESGEIGAGGEEHEQDGQDEGELDDRLTSRSASK